MTNGKSCPALSKDPVNSLFTLILFCLFLSACTQSDMLMLSSDKCYENTTEFQDYTSCLDKEFFADLKELKGSNFDRGMARADEVKTLLTQLLEEDLIDNELARLSFYDHTLMLVWQLERDENSRALAKSQSLPSPANYRMDAISTSVTDAPTDVDSGNFRSSQISGAVQYCIYEADDREFATVIASHQVCSPTFGL